MSSFPVLGHKVQGLKNMHEAIVPGIYRDSLLDLKLTVEDEDAFEAVRQLALREGVFAGMSSGAAVVGALRAARDLSRGSTVVVIIPDRGDRYLSTTLFRSVCGGCPPELRPERRGVASGGDETPDLTNQ